MENLKNNLGELKSKYDDLLDLINLEKANGSLSKLVDLRSQFDETFDQFFDNRDLRIKYNAWNEEQNNPNFDISNRDLEEKLNEEDTKELIKFYEEYIERLTEELRELTSENDPFSEVITFKEASERWGLDDSTLRKYVERCKFFDGEYRKSGGTNLIKVSAMVRLFGDEKEGK